MNFLNPCGPRAHLGLDESVNLNILIAGGTGYLGSRLADYCVSSGSKVIVLTRKKRGTYSENKSIEYKEFDWQNFGKFSAAFHSVDTVINAAGITSIEYKNDPSNALYRNREIIRKLNEASQVANVKHFLQMSSIHVYGNNLKGVVTELTKVDEHQAYARGHIESEKVVLSSKVTKGTVLRLSNVFGPPGLNFGDCWNLVVNAMCKEAVLNKTITLKSPGEQFRNFLPISELIARVEALTQVSDPTTIPNTINIGGVVTISILEIAKKIRERCAIFPGFEPEINLIHKKISGKTEYFELSNSTTDFMPKFSHVQIDKELDATIRYVYENRL
jgi:UDP-glucose 4-epimerase